MAFQGGNLEKKEIGLSIGVSGTHYNTEIDSVTGELRLKAIEHDANGEPIYAESGSWTSDVVDLEDNFNDFEKVFTKDTKNGASSFAVLTRVSKDSLDWSDWTPIAMDGTIQSDTMRYIQVKIDLFAGFVDDVIVIAKKEFENDFILEKEYKKGAYIVPTLTSNTSSPDGFAFSDTIYSSSYPAWKAFDKNDGGIFIGLNAKLDGILGFYFTNPVKAVGYLVKSSSTSSYISAMPNTWVLQGSNDTTDGLDGTWDDLDEQSGQVYTSINQTKEYDIKNPKKYKAYRINYSKNNGGSYTGIGELDFRVDGTTSIQLKRNYEYSVNNDSTWVDEGVLFRKKITRDEWLRIDKVNL